ncbi:MAG TPA: cell wall-binding repeat-containing protein [Coriobacteriia bacterium]|jgi:putative cell wall-binding protein
MRNRLPRCIVLLVAGTALGLAAAASAFAATKVYIPIQGRDRTETAVAASKAAFPRLADTLVVCTGWNWPDALGGGALAGVYGGPLLLTRPTALSSGVASEAIRLDARNVVLIGSEEAVSADVESALRALTVNGHGLNVTRIGGKDRFETAAMVASTTVAVMRARGRTYDGTAFFTTGYNFPDALAAAPLSAKRGWPVLLVRPSEVPSATDAAITAIGVRRGIVLGSESAVGKNVADALAPRLASPPERLSGPDRYITALEIARFSAQPGNGLGWDGLAFATGDNFPDALAGGVMQARLGSVLLLTPTAELRQCARAELAARRAEITAVRYLGSTSALSERTRAGVAVAWERMLFPVAGPHDYTDTFGAPRSGGRTHKGTDIMAAMGTWCVASLDGTVTIGDGGLGGRVVYLYTENGWEFYYAHLSNWAVRSGQHVTAGQLVGYVGNTGNAAGGPTHLHFQIWTPDGLTVNPYPYCREMERR